MKSRYLILLWLALSGFAFTAIAQPKLKPFNDGSYRQILKENADKPFMLVVWSINCSSCLKEMSQLGEIQKLNTGVKMIMLSVDEMSEQDAIEQLLSRFRLDGYENWVFADDNAQKLRFEIDPGWYGELPRTYFFDAAHQRTAVSGVMSKQDYEAILAKLVK